MKQQSGKVFCQLKCMYKLYKVNICVCRFYGIFIMYDNSMQLSIHVVKFFQFTCSMVYMGMFNNYVGFNYLFLMSLKLSTFNCSGIQDNLKRTKISHYLRSIGSDIIFLQETHCSDKDEQFWKTQWGEHGWFSNHTSNSRGVAILIRNSVPLKLSSVFKDPNGRFLIVSLLINNTPVVLVNLYAPNDDDPNFYFDLFAETDKFERSDTSLLIGGDFNAVLGPMDYQGSQSQHSNKKSKDTILGLMDEFNLIDVWRHFNPNLKQYTRHQAKPKTLSRLDFILVSSNLISNCIGSKILPSFSSDHSVVTCNFKVDENPRVEGTAIGNLIVVIFNMILSLLSMLRERLLNSKRIIKALYVIPISFGMPSNVGLL